MIDDMDSDIECDADGVNFIDMTGDGLEDLVCLDKQGDAFLSVNQGDGDRKAKKPPTFKNVGRIKNTETTGREWVVLADIDGDGRGDYGVMYDSDGYDDESYVKFWRNGWVNDKPKYWQPLGSKKSGYFRMPEVNRFEDLNGDVSECLIQFRSCNSTNPAPSVEYPSSDSLSVM